MLRTVAGELLAFGSTWPKIEERYLHLGSLGSILDEVRQKRS